MCGDGGGPGSVAEALGMLDRALDYLTAAEAASLPAAVQAEALRALERAESRHTAARARVLAGFMAQGGFADDGHGTARAWLKWQTQVTASAAAGAVGWARRLAAHPVIATALAAGELSRSWARQICEWTDRLPADRRSDADEILAGAARGGASLAALGGLAREMYERSAPAQDDDGFEDRWFRLGITFRGAGRAEGDLTPGCAAALAAVLEALGKKAGPEDTRTAAQRRHDALEEACRRLIGAGMVPARGGQPAQVMVHLTLGQLRDLPGGSAAEAAWAAARASQPGWLTGPDAAAALCDATVVPVVTGHADQSALDRLAAFLLVHSLGRHASDNHPAAPGIVGPGHPAAPGHPVSPATAGPGHPGRPAALDPDGVAPAGPGTGPLDQLSPASRDRLRRALLGLAADALSGPGGLAARLRAALDGTPLAGVSLPLDIGAPTQTIPAHLRRAVITRHRHCAFPGCDQPATICDIHHLIPRCRAGPTSLANLVPLCSFHHLTAIHRWGWTLALHGDGTTTATSPDGTRTLHSHGPPHSPASRGTPDHGPPGRAA